MSRDLTTREEVGGSAREWGGQFRWWHIKSSSQPYMSNPHHLILCPLSSFSQDSVAMFDSSLKLLSPIPFHALVFHASLHYSECSVVFRFQV